MREKDLVGETCHCRQLLAESGVDAKNVGCGGKTGLGSLTSILPVDAEGTALCNAILYGVDSRSHKEIEWLYEYYTAKEAEACTGTRENAPPTLRPKYCG